MIKAIVMIGGGVQEIKAVRDISSAGFKSIVTDRNKDAPCFEYADYKIVRDGKDANGIIREIINLTHKHKGLSIKSIKAVYTCTELYDTVAIIARVLDLDNHADVISSFISLDKSVLKRKWMRSGISTPMANIFSSLYDAKNFIKKINNKKYIVKPAVGFGSKGCKLLDISEDINKDLEKAFAATGNGGIIIEEYASGTLHDVNAVFYKDKFYGLTIADRVMEEWPYVWEKEAYYPSCLNETDKEKMFNLTEEAARSVGLNKGPVKSDIILTKSGPKILEIAPRLHGPKGTLYLIPYSTGASLIDYAYRTLCGTFDGSVNIASKRYSGYKAIMPKGRRFKKSVNGILAAIKRKNDYIKKIMLFPSLGNRLCCRQYESSHDVLGYIFCIGKSYSEVREKLYESSMTIEKRIFAVR